MEQGKEPSRKTGMLVYEVSRSIAALSRSLECGRAAWFWEISAIF